MAVAREKLLVPGMAIYSCGHFMLCKDGETVQPNCPEHWLSRMCKFRSLNGTSYDFESSGKCILDSSIDWHSFRIIGTALAS